MRHWQQIFGSVLAAAVWAACVGQAHAGGRANGGVGQHATGDLKTSSGGTGIAKGGGTGGTGLPTTVNQPLTKIQSTMTPDHAVAPPPAGPRPHTDLAAAEKRSNLSSVDLIKRSTLYNKIAAPVGDPLLVKPVLGKIGATVESARSFHAVPGFTAEESKGDIHPANGRTSTNGHPMASLSSGGTPVGLASAAAANEIETGTRGEGGWLLQWLGNLLAASGTAALGWWAWKNVPQGARMTMPAASGPPQF